MSQLFNTGIIVSRGNSTNVPLLADQEFIGSTDDVTSYQEIDINLGGSPSNAPGNLYFEFSPDQINWDVSIWVSGQTLVGPTVVPQCLRVILPYFRVKYINGSTDQTQFRLTVIYHRTGGTRLTRYLNQPVDFTEPLENVQAFMAAKNQGGGFSHLNVVNGALQVDGSQVIQPVSIDGYVYLGNEISIGTVNQGNANTLINSWTTQITDGYNGPAAVTAPNTSATTSDPALVVAISPNNSFTISPQISSNVSSTSIMASDGSTLLLDANTNRLGVTIYNDSMSGFLYINLGAAADASDFVIKLLPLMYYEIPFGYTGLINGSWSIPIGYARISEFT